MGDGRGGMEDLKSCSKCNTEKPVSCFYKYKSGINKGYYYSYCKDCNRNYLEEWKIENKEHYKNLCNTNRRKKYASDIKYKMRIVEQHSEYNQRPYVKERKRIEGSKKRRYQIVYFKNMLGGKCSICGYDKNYASLDFHHPGKKEISLGKLFGRAKMEIINEEAKKCILVCRNCHMEIHHPEYTKIGMGVIAIK